MYSSKPVQLKIVFRCFSTLSLTMLKNSKKKNLPSPQTSNEVKN